MKTRNILALAAFGGLLVAAGCKDKDDAKEDSARSAMTDTTTMAPAPAPAVTTDSTAGTTMPTDTTKTGTYGDTIKR